MPQYAALHGPKRMVMRERVITRADAKGFKRES